MYGCRAVAAWCRQVFVQEHKTRGGGGENVIGTRISISQLEGRLVMMSCRRKRRKSTRAREDEWLTELRFTRFRSPRRVRPIFFIVTGERRLIELGGS